MGYKAVYYTDVGIKKKTNQDSLAIKVIDTPKGQVAFAIICDGMGGLSKGELASKEVICAYCDWFENQFTDMIENNTFNASVLRDQWFSIARMQNERLKAYGAEQGIMIGTTLSAMLMYEDKYYIIHVGDSRVYELAEECRQITKDQTFVAREVAAGRMTEEQAETDSRRSILLQCIGASPVVEPDFIRGDIRKNVNYMMCSDGFRHKITKEEIMENIGPSSAVDDVTMTYGCTFLTETVKQRKETDNVTVLLIRSE